MYDLIVMGGGPAGYVAAERAGLAGLKVLLAERKQLGGVCLNEGCIPSKALLNSAKIYQYAIHGAAFGVRAENVSFDLAAAHAHKTRVMDTLRRGVSGLMKKCKVEVVTGDARLLGQGRVRVGESEYEARNILVATGSAPARPPIPGQELPHVVDSTGILSLEKMPRKLVIIGGGVIGCEFACFFGSLGVAVTVIEMLPEICPSVDAEVAALLRTELAKKNVTFILGARVEKIGAGEVHYSVGGAAATAAADVVLLSTGRVPNVQGLGLEEARVDFDRRGIKVDDRCATNVPGVWAAGDVTGRAWLAHAASRMGEVVVHNILGKADRMRFDALPGVVYTNPEVATAGLTEAEAKRRGVPVRTAKLPVNINGRFLAEHADERGLCKVLTHAETGVLLGVHMIGGACSEMIFGASAMIETETRVREIEEMVFPHPTVSELIRDTVLAAH